MDLLRTPPSLRRSILSHPQISLALHRLTSTLIYTPFDTHNVLPPPPPPPSTPLSQALLTLSPTTLNAYTTSNPPSSHNLKSATTYLTRHAPSILYSAAHFRSFPPSPYPEIAFLGRSNVGKSSLLNALFGRPSEKPAHVSKRPGRTRTMNGFGVGAAMVGTKAAGGDEDKNKEAWKRFGRGGIVVVDMPGYGAGSREDWGTEALKFLTRRTQLRRTFVLVDAAHGLKSSDVQLLVYLRQNGVAHQVVLSKVDKILHKTSRTPGPQKLHNSLLQLRDIRDEVRRKLNAEAGEDSGRDGVGDILCCSAEKSLSDEQARGTRMRGIGIDEVRWAVVSACGVDPV